jgi:regulator of protease activity HflC (stomatin/prohibitin superfamily)
MSRSENPAISIKSMFIIVACIIGGIFAIWATFNIIGFNKAGESIVVQYPNGKMKAILKAGPYQKWWGDSKIYRNYATVGFGVKHKDNSAISVEFPAVTVPFADNTIGQVPCILRISLPTNEVGMLKIRNEYAGGYDHFVANGIVPVASNAIKLSANLRTSQEAITTLAVFQRDVEDQLMLGIYETKTVEKWVHKSTGDSERVKMTEIVIDPKTNLPMRRSTVLEELGCTVTQCQIDVPQFDESVQNMLKQRRDQSIQTEISKQAAIRADQDKITAERQGQAAVMKVKYEKEMEKQAAVTDAEKEKAVAELNKQAAEFTKKKLILEGEGEAEKRKLIMNADGALQIKVDALIEINNIWATAYKSCPNRPTPDIIMGGSGTQPNGGNAALNFMDIQNARALQSLNLDMHTRGTAQK